MKKKKEIFELYYNNPVGYEMEGISVFRICRNNNIQQWIIVKGISDFGDGSKHDSYQTIASENAVSLCHYVFSQDGLNEIPKVREIFESEKSHKVPRMVYEDMEWENVIQELGILDKNLVQYLALGISDYERRDIPIHTPQVLLLLLKYPESVSYRVLNEYITSRGEPYGEYLQNLLERENERYEQSNNHFSRGFDFGELLGIRKAEEQRKEKNILCITENLLFYSIMEQETSITIQELKRTFGEFLFEEIKLKIKRNVTPF